jgi:acid phosphatase class B
MPQRQQIHYLALAEMKNAFAGREPIQIYDWSYQFLLVLPHLAM